VKLDLSNNGLQSRVVAHLLDALMTNNTVTEVNLHGNWLNDEFASDLGELLKENPILYKVDISQNPIGNDGALKLLDDLNSKNDTLNSLGDLSQNVLMGVKVRKDIEDALWLNSVSSRAKQSKLKLKRTVVVRTSLKLIR